MRYPHNLSHRVAGTYKMGYIYPSTIIEAFPSDSMVIEEKILARFTPQISPNMDDVFVGNDVYTVPWRQLFDKLGLDWDAFLTGGEDGSDLTKIPSFTIPQTGFDKGSLADFLGYPTNFVDTSTTPSTTVIVGAGQKMSALKVIAYMHIINENYRDQNFIKKLDLTKYYEFLTGTYDFKDASGNSLGYQLGYKGLFPKAQPRDFFGRALPNTQRGPQAMLPIGGTATLQPSYAPVVSSIRITATPADMSLRLNFGVGQLLGVTSCTYTILGKTGTAPIQSANSGGIITPYFSLPLNLSVFDYNIGVSQLLGAITILGSTFEIRGTFNALSGTTLLSSTSASIVKLNGDLTTPSGFSLSFNGTSLASSTVSQANLSNVITDLSRATGIAVVAFRLAARIQKFGEILQVSGARSVEFTLAMFGVRIPDERIQRPLFHGSFRLPVLFSEVLQTSSTNATSPQGNLAGHGITGGTNQPIHIKCIEHCFIFTVTHIMPRSSYQNMIHPMDDRFTRWDVPNPMFQHIGEQPLKRKYIYPNSANPEQSFGFVPRYSELATIPSSVHGEFKDTYSHYMFSKIYTPTGGEPVLSAKWRYETPTGRPFALPDADKVQMICAYKISAKRPFQANPQTGIHVV